MGSPRASASSTSILSGPRGVSTAIRSQIDTAKSSPHVVHSGVFVADFLKLTRPSAAKAPFSAYLAQMNLLSLPRLLQQAHRLPPLTSTDLA